MRERLRVLRKKLGLNQSDFASKIHMAQTSYSQLETGKHPIKDSHVALICNVFKVNESWLRTGEGEPFAQEEKNANNKLDSMIAELGNSQIIANLLYAFDSLAPDQQAAVLEYARRFIQTMLHDASESSSQSDTDLVGGALRQALAARSQQDEETSSTSSPKTHETA